MPHSSFGHETTAFRPIEPADVPWNIHCSTPLSSATTFGASSAYFAGTWRSNMSGGSTTWSSMLTRIMSSIRMALLRVLRQSGTRRSIRPPGEQDSRMDLGAVQDLMEATYGEHDRARGLPAAVAWLTEEVGELSRCGIREGSRSASMLAALLVAREPTRLAAVPSWRQLAGDLLRSSPYRRR